jgi:hypothetical protein
MARLKHLIRPGIAAARHPGFLRHLARLDVATVADYQTWCEVRGFSRGIEKSSQQRRRELETDLREGAVRALTRRPKSDSRPERVIAAIFAGRTPRDVAEDRTYRPIERFYSSPGASVDQKRAARRLLMHIARNSILVSAESAVESLGRVAGNSYVEGVLALAELHGDWINDPEDWEPDNPGPARQFAALARHLFARWPVPRFMDSAWFYPPGESARQRRRWFLHIGQGENIRHADLPVRLTKKMAHHFLEAPADLSIDAAIRWGQVLTLGGAARLARSLVGTRLERSFDDDEFWLSVVRWLIERLPTADHHVGPILDYIHNQKFVPAMTLVDGQVRAGPPAQPNFSMKDREPDVLLRQVEAWHRDLGHSAHSRASWEPSGIEEFRLVEEATEERSERVWTVRELLCGTALAIEGREMHHCVASYTYNCTRGLVAIFTMEREEAAGRFKLLTIEVDRRTKAIRQARGKANTKPDGEARKILQCWATAAGLVVQQW